MRKPVVANLFEETPGGARLLGSRCAGCGMPYFPRSPVCHNPKCDESRIEEAAFGPSGRLWSFTVQHYAPPAPVKYDQPFRPYALGLVDMDEGLRVLARIQVERFEDIRIGMRLELVAARLCTDADGNEITSWMFRPC